MTGRFVIDRLGIRCLACGRVGFAESFRANVLGDVPWHLMPQALAFAERHSGHVHDTSGGHAEPIPCGDLDAARLARQAKRDASKRVANEILAAGHRRVRPTRRAPPPMRFGRAAEPAWCPQRWSAR